MKNKFWDNLCTSKDVSFLVKKCTEQLNVKMDLFQIHLMLKNTDQLKKLLTEAFNNHNSHYKENKIKYSKLDNLDYAYIATHFANQVTANLIDCTIPGLRFSHDIFKPVSDVAFPPELIEKRKNELWGKIPQNPLVHTLEQWEVVNTHCAQLILDLFKTQSVENLLNKALSDWKIARVEYDNEVEKEISQAQESFHQPSCG